MFHKLKQKWKVGGLQLFLIICTFALGGSLTGFIGKKIMNQFGIEQDWLWAILYIFLITIIWPIAVIIVSVPLGQFRFFKVYIRKIGLKMGLVKSEV
jgi:MFS family permease